MLLTIVTVTKNDSYRLFKTIKSLSKYYCNDWVEHLIIDGSTDQKTQNLITKHSNNHANVLVKFEKDYGIYDAMNKGINKSSGKYLMFLNSGDQISIDPIKLFRILNSKILKTKEILCFSFYESWNGKYYKKYSLGNTIIKLPTSHQAMIFNRRFIIKNKYKINYKIAGDFELYHRAIPEKIKHFNATPPLCIVEGSGMASRNPLTSYFEYCKVILHKYTFKSLFFLIILILKGFGSFVIKNIISESLYTKIKMMFNEIKK